MYAMNDKSLNRCDTRMLFITLLDVTTKQSNVSKTINYHLEVNPSSNHNDNNKLLGTSHSIKSTSKPLNVSPVSVAKKAYPVSSTYPH